MVKKKKNENSIKLTWNYYCLDESGDFFNKKSISERVYPGDEINDSVLAYFADLEYIRRVKLDIFKRGTIQWGDVIEETKEMIPSDYLPAQMARRSDYIMLQIIAMVAFHIKRMAILRLSGADNDLHTIQTIQSQTNTSCRAVSTLFRLVTERLSFNAEEVWNELLERAQTILSEIEGISETLQQIINKYLPDIRDRCIGLFVFDNHSIDPLISFSGYLDCTDEVKELVGAKASASSRTLKAFNDVCASIGAKLVRSSPCVKRYYPNYLNLIDIVCLKEESKVNNDKNELRKNYSCCERKIFTEFEARSGSLFTTIIACSECENAFAYYEKKMSMIVKYDRDKCMTCFCENHQGPSVSGAICCDN
jgi:hypothetical protein